MSFRHQTHDEIVFRVLLQREEQRAHLNFGVLEEALPKAMRKAIESDWRAYIRDEALGFDSAYQKAVRKHIPGVYYVVMAAEYLGNLPFHVALGHFLRPGDVKWHQSLLQEADVFELAEWLTQEVRKRRASERPATPQKAPPPAAPKPVGPVRRCGFCKREIPVKDLAQHIDRHLNPLSRGDGRRDSFDSGYVPPQPIRSTPVRVSDGYSTQSEKGSWSAQRTERDQRHQCIGCGNPAIPGDFYCYSCSPD